MPAGDAEDKARYAEYHRLIALAKECEERAITAPTVFARRNYAESAKRYRQRAFHLFA